MNSAELRGQVWLGSQVWGAFCRKGSMGGPIFQVHHEGAVRVGHDSLNFVARGYVVNSHLPGLMGSPSAFISHQAMYQSGAVYAGVRSRKPLSFRPARPFPRCREGEYP